MRLTEDMLRAIAFLCEVTDIDDFAAKVNRGGFLRTATRSHLERLFSLGSRESEKVCEVFVLLQAREED